MYLSYNNSYTSHVWPESLFFLLLLEFLNPPECIHSFHMQGKWLGPFVSHEFVSMSNMSSVSHYNCSTMRLFFIVFIENHLPAAPSSSDVSVFTHLCSTATTSSDFNIISCRTIKVQYQNKVCATIPMGRINYA